MIALKLAMLTGTMFAGIDYAPAAEKPADSYASQQAQCRREAPAQFGPRAAVRPTVQMCVATAQPNQRCGHYELHWPHWIAQRALPPVRQWVSERC